MSKFPKVAHDYYAVRRHPDGTEERRGPFDHLDPAHDQAKRWTREQPLSITLETFEDGTRINTRTIRWKAPIDADERHDD